MSTRNRKSAANGAATPSKSTSSSSSPSTSAILERAPSALHSPFVPTPYELTLLALYPLILLLGSLAASLSPWLMAPSNKSTYSHIYQSYQPAADAPSYFATKANVFNVYFVKIGWFWVSLALLLFTALASRGRAAIDVGFAAGNPRRERVLQNRTVRLSDLDETTRRHERDERLRRVYQTVLRWVLITTLWYTITQRFFGPSIIDRVFRATGGHCRTIVSHPDSQTAQEYGMPVIEAKSYGECRRRGGRFVGGLDVSGHVFLLVLGSGMLFLEVLPVVLPWVRGLTTSRLVRSEGRVEQAGEGEDMDGPETPVHSYGTRAASRAKKVVEAQSQTREKPVTTRLKEYALWLTSGVLVLSWWMLLMTAAFFHSWQEKSGALVVAGTCLWAVYALPRGVEVVRAVVGMPAV